MDVCLGLVESMPSLYHERRDELYNSNSRGLFPKPDENYGRNYGHIYFKVDVPGSILGSFMIVTQKVLSGLWERLRSHRFLYYPVSIKTKTASTLHMERVSSLLPSFLPGRRYFQHGGPKCNGFDRLGFYMFFRPINVQLNDAIAFVYRGTLTIGVTSRENYAGAKVMRTHGPVTSDEEGKYEGDGSEMENYCITSQV